MVDNDKLIKVIEAIKKKLGHWPSADEIATALNGNGLMELMKEIENEEKDSNKNCRSD